MVEALLILGLLAALAGGIRLLAAWSKIDDITGGDR